MSVVATTPIKDSLLDSKPYVEHHPTFGYAYIPNVKMELPRPGGGRYRMVTNSQGIRSDREYAFQKPPGVKRIIICGDSMAAGQFTSNDQRFSELLERRVPGLEVLNLALEGTGTDQQLLIYENVGSLYEHDAVVVMPFLQNIRRNMVEARVSIDPKTLAKVLAPKPRFELKNGQLELLNVPVSKERKAVVEGDQSTLNGTDSELTASRKIKNKLNGLPGIGLAKKVLYQANPWEPFPEYKSAGTKEWQLMEAILKRFKTAAGTRPLVIVPIFYDSYVRYRMARNYWTRFSELEAIPGVHVWDLLPHFRQLGPEASRCFLEPYDAHFSAYGHLVVTEFLEQKLKEAGLVPANRAASPREI